MSMIGFSASWKGDKPLGWFGVMHDGWAGATILPLWLIAAGSLAACLIRTRWLLTSKANLVMVATLAAVCLWYVGTFPIYTGMTADLPPDVAGAVFVLALVLIPAGPCVNYFLLLIYIWRRRQLTGPWWPFATGWGTALAATIWARCVAARAYWQSLPDEPPDCFVVSAAARGHAGFVGSRPDPATGRPVNHQLRRLRAFEVRLAADWPAGQRRLRRAYNLLGPVLAARIRSPWAADAAYLLLKPLELLAACRLRSGGEKGGRT
jgi:hypothetical protein